MSYYFSTTLQTSFEDALSRVVKELEKEGFGILTDIDVAKTLEGKLNVKFRKYRILGACDPQYAYRALELEDKIGTMLPCSVIVQEVPGVGAEVAAIDPVASMQAVENPELQKVAGQVREKLRNIITKAV
jgi:uncharacterized protein (DUF302 family)